MEKQYRTLSGRNYDLNQLGEEEHAFLDAVATLYRGRPDWNEFGRTWVQLGRKLLWGKGKIPVGSPLYRVCQDMEARLGIAEGRVASPDYRDRIADLVEERYGSRYAFCKEIGIDQGNLSKVLAGKTRHLSPETLFKVLEHLEVEIELVGREEVFQQALDPFGPGSPTEQLLAEEHFIATLRNLLAMAESYPPEEQASLLTDEGLFADGLEQIRLRVKEGESFETAVNQALAKALDRRVRLAKEMATQADEEREAHQKVAG